MERSNFVWPASALLVGLLLSNGALADLTAEARISRAERGSERCQAGPCPQDLEGQLSVVVALVESRREEAALEALDVLDAIAPHDERSGFWRARALVALGRVDEAEDALRAATSAGALALRGQLAEERGDRQSALSDYRASSALRPTLELELAVARVAERLGFTDLAMQTLEIAVRRTESGLVRAEAARLADRLGHYEIALEHVDALLAVASSARWRVLRAGILVDAGRPVQAEAELDRAMSEANARVLRRGGALMLSERARVHIAQGSVELARRDLEQAIRIAPAWQTARALLSTISAQASGADQ